MLEEPVLGGCLSKLNVQIDNLNQSIENVKSTSGSLFVQDLLQSLESNAKSTLPIFIIPSTLKILSIVSCYVDLLKCKHGDSSEPQAKLWLEEWNSPLGQMIIRKLGHLYATMLWEKTILEGLGDFPIQPRCDAIRNQTDNVFRIVSQNESKQNNPVDQQIIHSKHFKPILSTINEFDICYKYLLKKLVKVCFGLLFTVTVTFINNESFLFQFGIIQPHKIFPSQAFAETVITSIYSALTFRPTSDPDNTKIRYVTTLIYLIAYFLKYTLSRYFVFNC